MGPIHEDRPSMTTMALFEQRRWRPGRLAKNTIALGTGMGLRALAQGLVFLIVARTLGTEGYGAFSAVLAWAGVWVHFCGLGGPVILIRNVARDPESFSQNWGLTLAAMALGTFPVLVVFAWSAWRLLPDLSCWLLVSLGLAELVFWPLANAGDFAYRGFERMGRSARLLLTPVLARLMAAFALVGLVHWQTKAERVKLWGCLYAAASLMSAVYALFRATRDLGRPSWPSRRTLWPYIVEGLPFSFWGSANKIYVDADKFLLARMASLEITGIYSAGYRLIDLAFLPLHALLDAAVPRLFRAGAQGPAFALRGSLPLIWPAVGYALSIGIGMWLAAPLIGRLLGENYVGSIQVVRWLSWMPLVGLPRLLLSYAAATGDAQRLGMMAVLLGAVVNVILTIWWIPVWGWQGAAAATYASEIFMSVMLAALFFSKV